MRSSLILLVSASAAFAQTSPPALTLAPHTLRTYDGVAHEIELGKLVVPESRRHAGGPTVTVAFYRLRSTAATPGFPIVFLMGGPGIATSLIAPIPPYWTLFDHLRAAGDVILLDQRGLGLSTPVVNCPPVASRVDTNLLMSQAASAAAYRAVVASCAAHWRAQGIDPRAYSDEAIADDVDDIRAALGAARVSLLSFSYGTRLAMTYARRHSDRIDRVVLQGPTDGELMYRSPLRHDSLLARFASIAATDTASATFARDLVARIRVLFARAERTPFVVRIHTVAGDSQPIPVGRSGLQGLISGHLGDSRIPAFVSTVEAGDLTILTRWVESMYNDLSGGAGSLMARAVTCSSPPSAPRRTLIDADGKRSIFGESADNFVVTESFCSSLGGDAPASIRKGAVPIARPALFITGEFDDRTPPSNADVLAAEFVQPVRIVVENGGHELLPSPAVSDVVVNFMLGTDVSGTVLRERTPRFLSIESAKLPPRRPGQ